MSALEEKLRSELQETHWDALAIHAERGRLIVVSPKLDLLTAAVAIAEDNKSDVETFLTTGLLSKAGEPEIAAFDKEDNPRFRFVIVQPFVLARRIEVDTEAEDLN